MDDIVRHYLRFRAAGAEEYLDLQRSQKTYAAAVEKAAMAEDKRGKRFSHQRRIPRAALCRARDVLLAEEKAVRKCADFDGLLSLVDQITKDIPHIGRLTVYDTTHRLGAYLGITGLRQPNVQLFIDRPLELDAERITVFRLQNYGGGVGNGIEVRFAPKIGLQDIKLISTAPQAVLSGGPVLISVPKLKPKDGVAFYIREPKNQISQVRELIESAVYEEGNLRITTLDERLESYVWQKQRDAFFNGLIVGILSFAVIVILEAWIARRRTNRAQPLSRPATPGLP